MRLIMLIGLLNLIVLSVSVQDLARVKPGCFYNKDKKLILKIDDEGIFLLVGKEIYFGTKYLLVEKGFVKRTTNEEFEFSATSLTILEEKKIDLTKKEDLTDVPFRTYGELNDNGIKMTSKGVYVKRCPCKRKVFDILDRLKDF